MIDKNGKLIHMSQKERKEFIKNQLGIDKKTKSKRSAPLEPKDIIVSIVRNEAENFKDALDMIREVDPKTYVKTYVELARITVATEKNINKNVKLGIDLDDIRQLAQRTLPSADTEVKKIGEFAEYIEIASEPRQEISKDPIPTSAVQHPSIKEDLRTLNLPSIPTD